MTGTPPSSGAAQPDLNDAQLDSPTVADVMELSDPQRQLVIWLMRQGAVSLSAIAQQFNFAAADVSPLLADLLAQGYLEAVPQSDGSLYYQTPTALQQGIRALNEAASPSTVSQPISVILNSTGEDLVTPGQQFQLSAIIRHRGAESAIIDVFLDELPPTLSPWCQSIQERLALDTDQSGEVVFSFDIPVNALPGIHSYWLVVDAPHHYPNHPPLRYGQTLQVLPPVQGTVQVSDPTFALQPATSAATPASLAPGGTLALQLIVYNRAERVDRFRLLCSDLPASWIKVTYPQGVQDPGLALAEDYLDLNPAEQGIIDIQITPPIDARAGSYIPTLRLRSENRPELSLMDLLYLEIQPLYQVDFQFITLASRVRQQPGRFQVQAVNQGNTVRSLLLSILELDGGDQCRYTLNPERLQLEPKQTLISAITVQPKHGLRRPIWGGGRLMNFGVTVRDEDAFPLPEVPLQGYILWEARPWWQILPLILLGIGGLVGLVVLIWWWLLRPPVTPQVLRFAANDTQYSATDEDAVRLNFQVSYPYQIETLEIMGQSPEGEVTSGPITYDLSNGIPPELRANCAVQRQQMTCTNLRTDALRAGDYVFTLTIVPKPGRGRAPSQGTTPLVSILPVPLPEIVGFAPNQPNYLEAAPQPASANGQGNGQQAPAGDQGGGSNGEPEGMVRLSWAIANHNNINVVELVGRNAEGAIVMPLIQFDWRNGVPDGLKPFCQIQQVLICEDIPTGVNQAGDYTFELTVLPRSGPTETPIRQTTEVVKIVPRPPRIIRFLINGTEAQPKYLLPIAQGQLPPQVAIAWEVEATPGTQVALNPTPGTVPPQGEMVIPLSPDPGETVLMLQVTNSAGDQITRAVTIQTYDPTPQGPDTIVVGGDQAGGGGDGGSGGDGGGGDDLTTPNPSQPGQLSPSELPPQFD